MFGGYCLLGSDIVKSGRSLPDSSETSVTIYQNTLRHIPENGGLHSHRGENLNSRKLPQHMYRMLRACSFIWM
jgi:hypothetical protein